MNTINHSFQARKRFYAQAVRKEYSKIVHNPLAEFLLVAFGIAITITFFLAHNYISDYIQQQAPENFHQENYNMYIRLYVFFTIIFLFLMTILDRATERYYVNDLHFAFQHFRPIHFVHPKILVTSMLIWVIHIAHEILTFKQIMVYHAIQAQPFNDIVPINGLKYLSLTLLLIAQLYLFSYFSTRPHHFKFMLIVYAILLFSISPYSFFETPLTWYIKGLAFDQREWSPFEMSDFNASFLKMAALTAYMYLVFSRKKYFKVY